MDQFTQGVALLNTDFFRGENEWISLRLMDSPTFYQFRVQHALVIYTLLPVRIKTSNIDAAQRPGEIQETHAAGPRIRPDPLMLWCMTSTLVAIYFASCSISKRGYPRMAFISAASFSALQSSVIYLRSLYIISQYSSFPHCLLYCGLFIVCRRCMMQPIIFLLLTVVSISQKIFFSLVYLPFSS